jgi:hypothetical protein
MSEHVQADRTEEPRIFLRVQQLIKGQMVTVDKEVSLEMWHRARYPGALVEAEINHALAEVNQCAKAVRV